MGFFWPASAHIFSVSRYKIASGGSDLAEPFKMSGAEDQTPKGAVVVSL